MKRPNKDTMERDLEIVVAAFATAMSDQIVRPDSQDAEDSQNEAYVMAHDAGWDWAADRMFNDFALKATPMEALAYGLELALHTILEAGHD